MTAIFGYQGLDVLAQWSSALSSPNATQAYSDISGVGSNAIGITTKFYLQNATSNSVVTDPVGSTTDADLLAGVKAAHAKGLKVLLAPGLIGYDGSSSYQAQPSNPAAFFASYTAAIVHEATVAQQAGVDTFSIGNEMSLLSGPAYQSYWLKLIAAVRGVYSGKLTYKAAMNEAGTVSFWSKLDVIGINAYPSLTASTTPSLANLEKAWVSVPTDDYWAKATNWQSPIDFMHSLATTYGKSVLITETGYRSVLGTAIDPAVAPPGTLVADQASQATAYQALFQTMQAQGGSWLSGLLLWQDYLGATTASTDFSPVGKAAMAVVQQYYAGQGAVPGLTVAASAVGQTVDLGAGNDTVLTGLGNDVIKAGSGNDTIVAGPSRLAPLTSTTVVVTGYGVLGSNGAAPQVALMINGTQVGATATFTPAADPSGYQTYTFTFANPYQVKSLDLALLNASSGASAEFRGLTVNGVAVSVSDVTNASAPGTFSLYVNSIHLDATSHQDWFYGAKTDNDTIDSGAGNDTINGGAGVDTVVYQGTRSAYALSRSGTSLVVADSVAGRDGTDTLTNVDYLQFSDTKVAVATLLAPDQGTAQVTALMTPLLANVAFASPASAASGTTAVQPQMTVAGASAAGATVTLLNGATALASTQASASGSYTFTLGGVADGVYTLSTKATLGNLSSSPSTSTTVVIGAAAKIVGLLLSSSVVPNAVYVTDINNPIVVSTAQLAALASGLRQMYTNYWLQVSDTAANVLAALDNLNLRTHLGAITLSDTHVFTTTLATMRHVVATDAATLAKITGGYSFVVTATGTNGSVSTSRYDSTGTLTSTSTVVQHGPQTETFVSYPDGSYDDTFADAAGNKLTESTSNASGHSYTVYQIAGQPYTKSVTLSDPAGNITAVTTYYASGSIYSQTTTGSDGSSSARVYDAAGDLTQTRTVAEDGTVHASTYDPQGNLLTDSVTNSTGTHWTQYAITGKAYAAMTVDNNASGVLQDIIQYNNDGSVGTTLYATGVTLSFTHAVDKIMSDGQDTFQLPSTPFHDVIQSFHGGSGLDHDTVVLSKALASSFGALSLSTSGPNTTVTIDQQHTIALVNATGTVTAANFKFV